MRYVIMANGHGTRWAGYGGGPKHLIEFDGETLLRRMVRQLSQLDPRAEVVISASDAAYETEGARRHIPERNEIELDRFVPELITDEVCFLYGDTLYSNDALMRIVRAGTSGVDFFGDEHGIVAVRSGDADALRTHLDRVRALYVAGEIDDCKGWQLYQSYTGQPFGPPKPGAGFTVLDELAVGFNTPDEYRAFTAVMTPTARMPIVR